MRLDEYVSGRGTEEESRFLTKGDNNQVHDQQLYQRGVELGVCLTCRSAFPKSRQHLRFQHCVCSLLRYVYYLDDGLSLVALHHFGCHGFIHSYGKGVVGCGLFVLHCCFVLGRQSIETQLLCGMSFYLQLQAVQQLCFTVEQAASEKSTSAVVGIRLRVSPRSIPTTALPFHKLKVLIP